jgi:hypothetical protein
MKGLIEGGQIYKRLGIIFQITNALLLSPPSEERVKGKGRMPIPNSTVFYFLFN